MSLEAWDARVSKIEARLTRRMEAEARSLGRSNPEFSRQIKALIKAVAMELATSE